MNCLIWDNILCGLYNIKAKETGAKDGITQF